MSEPADRRPPELMLPFGTTEDDFLASMTRLQAAGIVELVVHDRRTATGEISFTAPMFQLLQAGCEPFSEPGFVAAWLTGNPAAVRAWIEAAAKEITEREG